MRERAPLLYTFQYESIPHAISTENFAILASSFIIVSFSNIYPSAMQLTTAHENDSASTGTSFAVYLLCRQSGFLCHRTWTRAFAIIDTKCVRDPLHMLLFESVRARNRSCLAIYILPSLSLVEPQNTIANWGCELVLCIASAASAPGAAAADRKE